MFTGFSLLFLPDTLPILFVTIASQFITRGARASLDAHEWLGNCIPDGHTAQLMNTFCAHS